ncbi:MAG: hypothetical protein AAGH19_06970 [Pseudomonadota bacterium]
MTKPYPLLLLLAFIALSDAALAQCQTVGATADGGDVVECTGVQATPVVLGDNANSVTVFPGADIGSPTETTDRINLGAGDNQLLVLGGSVQTDKTFSADCFDFRAPGTHTIVIEDGYFECEEVLTAEQGTGVSQLNITINGGTLLAGEEVITNNRGGNNVILITGGTLIGDEGTIQSGPGNDRITITGGLLAHTTTNDEVISGGGGNDIISLSNSTIDGTITELGIAVAGNDGDDTIILGNGAEVIGIIDGSGPSFGGGTDTLIFEMETRSVLIDGLCAEIAAQGSQGEITINNLFYEWQNFENVRCQLKKAVFPVPTMGPSGLWLLMLVLLGAGLITVRRIG